MMDAALAAALGLGGLLCWLFPLAVAVGEGLGIVIIAAAFLSFLALAVLVLTDRANLWFKTALRHRSILLLLPIFLWFLVSVGIVVGWLWSESIAPAALFLVQIPVLVPVAALVYSVRRHYWWAAVEAAVLLLLVEATLWIWLPDLVVPHATSLLLAAIWVFVVPPRTPLRRLPKDLVLAVMLLLVGFYIVYLDNAPRFGPLRDDASNYFATTIRSGRTSLDIDARSPDRWVVNLVVNDIDPSSWGREGAFRVGVPANARDLEMVVGAAGGRKTPIHWCLDRTLYGSWTEIEYQCTTPDIKASFLAISLTYEPQGDQLGLGRTRFGLQVHGDDEDMIDELRSPDMRVVLDPALYRLADVTPEPAVKSPDQLYWQPRPGQPLEQQASFTLESRSMRMLADQGTNILALGSGALLASFATRAGGSPSAPPLPAPSAPPPARRPRRIGPTIPSLRRRRR